MRGEPDYVVNAVMVSDKMKKSATELLARNVEDECKSLCSDKRPSILRYTAPERILQLSDGTIQKELQDRAPTFHRFLQAAVATQNKTSVDESVKGVGIAVSVLLKNRNPKMSAMAYKMSLLLWHGGVDKQVCKYTFRRTTSRLRSSENKSLEQILKATDRLLKLNIGVFLGRGGGVQFSKRVQFFKIT